MSRIRALLLPIVVLALVAASARAQLQPTVHYFKFNEGTGATTLDDAIPGLGAAATLGGGAGWDTTNPRLGAAALKVGPGTGDVAKTNTPFVLSGSWSIETWFQDGNSYGAPYVYSSVSWWAHGTDYYWSLFDLFSDTTPAGLRCEVVDGYTFDHPEFGPTTWWTSFHLQLSGGGTNTVVIDQPNIVAGWNHVAYVHDAAAGTISAYLNGVLENVVAQPPGLSVSGTSTAGLGLGGDGSIDNWTGKLDEFRVWDVPLNQAQILVAMNLEIDGIPGIGQAPQAGLATLDLNNAQSPLLGAVSTGDNGPYTAPAFVGGPLDYVLGGVPGQPVILLFGPLNPVAATFPGIGQMDIGGLPDPVTGIPMGIQVLGNGFAPLDFIDLLFVIGASGETTLSFVLPNLPPSTIGAFQTANATGPGTPIALSNAVELTIL